MGEVQQQFERETSIPIYDSVRVTVWKALQMTGIDTARIQGWGRLFKDLR